MQKGTTSTMATWLSTTLGSYLTQNLVVTHAALSSRTAARCAAFVLPTSCLRNLAVHVVVDPPYCLLVSIDDTLSDYAELVAVGIHAHW